MKQPLPPDSNPQSPTSEPGIRQQAENSTMSGGMQAAQGNNNIQSQGNNNWLGNTLNIFLNQQPLAPVGNPTRPEDQRLLLDQVKHEVAARLSQSLHNAVPINLRKEQQPQQVKRLWDAETKIGLKPSSPLPNNTSIIEVFDQEDIAGKLLLLGVPGSGKTTTQLELAQALISRAENEQNYPIPVLFNLSSWKASWRGNRQSMVEWLVAELKSKYGIRAKLGKEWVENQKLLPLLDGLDELRSVFQESCVIAINQLLQSESRPQYLVVCSRSEEYTNYEAQLQINGAICLQPLTNIQIHNYLTDVNHAHLWQTISDDQSLLDLIRTPLLLSVTILAYQEISIEQWQRLISTEDRFQYLLDAYIRRMLTRQIDNKLYTKQRVPNNRQTRLWLIWLAQQLQRESQTEFLIEEIQPSWLRTSAEKRMYRLIVGLSSGLIAGLSCGLIFWLIVEPVSGLIVGLIAGLVFALDVGLNEEIKTVETLTWSWKKAKSKHELANSLITGVTCGLVYTSRFNLSVGLIVGLFSVLFYWLTRGGLSWSSDIGIETKIIPNQGIWKSVVNGGILGLSFGLLGGLSSGLSAGLSGGLSSGLSSGGRACIQHFTLRLILYRNGYIPWNYARFLDYATERMFLQRVGGRYRFIHKLLQDHFAQMPLDKLK